MRTWLYLLALMTSTLTFAQSPVDHNAQKTADQFLQGVKIAELPEGKQLLDGTLWSNKIELPTLSETSLLFEAMFDTDISGLQGYKRLVEAKILSKGGIALTKRYILIEYEDRSSGKWKVLGFTPGTDLEHEIEESEKLVKSEARTPQSQGIHRYFGHWLLMGGHVLSAEQQFAQAVSMNRENPSVSPYETQSSFDEALEMVSRIRGGPSK